MVDYGPTYAATAFKSKSGHFEFDEIIIFKMPTSLIKLTRNHAAGFMS